MKFSERRFMHELNGIVYVFAPLADISTFNAVYIDYHTTVWNNGEIDIDPEILYENGEECALKQ